MDKEEFKKLHLCKTCVNRCEDKYLGTLYHYCSVESQFRESCYISTPLNEIYPCSKSYVNLCAVKKCFHYKERED